MRRQLIKKGATISKVDKALEMSDAIWAWAGGDNHLSSPRYGKGCRLM